MSMPMLVHVDKVVAGGIELGGKELSLVLSLRTQEVRAFKQAA